MTRQPTPGVYENYREPGEFGEGVTVRRPCTCHPDDAPPVPCAERYALSECKTAVTDEELRSVGFSAMARNYPRDEMALAMFAAFQGNVAADQLPNGMRYFPNEWTQKAWQRVADAAHAFLTGGACDDRG